jgi:uncharacterized protein (TIGR03792 family)
VIVENLQFAVHPSVQKDWLEFEDEVWLPWLRQQPGFMRKQIRFAGGIATNMIWWKDKESWDQAATKTKEMERMNLQMRQKFGSRVTMLRSF